MNLKISNAKDPNSKIGSDGWEQLEVEPVAEPAEALREGWVLNGLVWEAVRPSPMGTSGSTFQRSRPSHEPS